MRNILRKTGRGLMGLVSLLAFAGCGNPPPEITDRNYCPPELARPSEGEINSARKLTRQDKVTRYLNGSYVLSLPRKAEIESATDFQAIAGAKLPQDGSIQTIRVGDRAVFRGGRFHLGTLWYRGMIGKDTFVLSGDYDTGSNYYSVREENVLCDGHEYLVREVNPTSITLDHGACRE